ncbi:hypothetical protein [Mammaliicoccus vitulinus]|uniref:hypothetical protein n=1 Tax=Mammaliicoccus vitulinus TaxID=71237 RepID=UPI00248ACAF6|nr:hypothetical protein [Mammaliicoccus vitulinus]
MTENKIIEIGNYFLKNSLSTVEDVFDDYILNEENTIGLCVDYEKVVKINKSMKDVSINDIKVALEQ